METIGPEDAAWLTSDEADQRLQSLAGQEVTPRLVSRLRSDHSASRAAALLEVADARQRGAAKFVLAKKMLLTQRGLQQATDQWIAQHKAERFRRVGAFVDVGCGVGGDLAGIGRAVKSARAAERSEALSIFAEYNTAVHGTSASLVCREAEDSDIAGCDAWHVDPDRRVAAKRTTRIEASEPSLETLERWRELTPSFAAKLAPAAVLDDRWQAECELEWISRGGECRQQVAWSGALARDPGMRRATRVSGSSARPTLDTTTFVGQGETEAARASTPGEWIYEPDPAVLAAGLTGAIANDNALSQIGAVAYLTGDRPVSQPLLTPFRVVEVLPLDRRKLHAWLCERSIGSLEIKVRGVRLDPAALQRELRTTGEESIVLLIAPTPSDPRKPLVIAAERVA